MGVIQWVIAKVTLREYLPHTHACFTAFWILSRTIQVTLHQKRKTNLDLLEQEIVSGSGNSWAMVKSAPWPRHITMPASHHSSFLQAGCHFCHPYATWLQCFLLRTCGGAEYCNEYVCLLVCVCLSAYITWKPYCLWPWLGPPLTVLQCCVLPVLWKDNSMGSQGPCFPSVRGLAPSWNFWV